MGASAINFHHHACPIYHNFYERTIPRYNWILELPVKKIILKFLYRFRYKCKPFINYCFNSYLYCFVSFMITPFCGHTLYGLIKVCFDFFFFFYIKCHSWLAILHGSFICHEMFTLAQSVFKWFINISFPFQSYQSVIVIY